MKVYYEFQPKVRMLVNGNVIEVEGRSIDDIYNRLFKLVVLGEQQASFFEKLLFPEAHALLDPFSPVMVAAAALVASTAAVVDQISACTGSELVTLSRCMFRSNAGVIQSMLSPERLTELKCQDKKLLSIKRMNGPNADIPIQYNFKFDSSSSLSQVNVYYEQLDKNICSYKIRKMKVTKVTKVKSSPSCGKKGMSIDRAAIFPIDRLIDCCKDDKCVAEMQEWIVKNRRAGATSSSSPTEKEN